MGIKDLLKTARITFGYKLRKATLADISNSYIAIDAEIFIHTMKYVNNDCLIGFLKMIIKLLSYNIVPIFVFGNGHTLLKNKEQQRRKDKINMIKLHLHEAEQNGDLDLATKLRRQYIEVKNEDFLIVKKLILLMKLPCITVENHEAESVCAYLNKNGYVSHVMTNDSDIYAYGAKSVIKNYVNSKDDFILIDADELRKVFNFDYKTKRLLKYGFDDINKFIDFCLLIGTDFNERIFSPRVAYQQIKDMTADESRKYVSSYVENYEMIVTQFTMNYIIDEKIELIKKIKPSEIISMIGESIDMNELIETFGERQVNPLIEQLMIIFGRL